MSPTPLPVATASAADSVAAALFAAAIDLATEEPGPSPAGEGEAAPPPPVVAAIGDAPLWEAFGWDPDEIEAGEFRLAQETSGGGTPVMPILGVILAVLLVALAIPGLRAFAYRHGWYR